MRASEVLPVAYSKGVKPHHALMVRALDSCVVHGEPIGVDERLKRRSLATEAPLRKIPTAGVVVSLWAPGGAIGFQVWTAENARNAARFARALDRCRAWRTFAAQLLAACDGAPVEEHEAIAHELQATPEGERAARAANRLLRAANRLPGERKAPTAGAIVATARDLAHAVSLARQHGAHIRTADGATFGASMVAAALAAAKKADGRTWVSRDGTIHVRWSGPTRRGGLDLRSCNKPYDRPHVVLDDACYLEVNVPPMREKIAACPRTERREDRSRW